MEAIWDEVGLGAQLAFRTLIPLTEDHVPLPFRSVVMPLLYHAPLVFLAYLSRRPGTYLVRLLLLPLAMSGALLAAYHFTWSDPRFNVYNWCQALIATAMTTKALQCGLTKEGMLKVGESALGIVGGKSKFGISAESGGNGFHPPADVTQNFLKEHIPSWISDSLEVLLTVRGLSFKFSQTTYLPPFTRPLTSRRVFLQATLYSLIMNYLLLDVFESLVKLFPGGIGTPLGGTMFLPQLAAPFPRYLASTIIHLVTGFAIVALFGMIYDLCTLIAVGIVGTSPTAWPPVLEKPWLAESMHELWGRRWHQLLTPTFLVWGGYPGKWTFEIIATLILAPWILVNPSANRTAQAIAIQFGNVGMLLGTFLASGLVHECTMFVMNGGFHFKPILFFASQGPILIGERVWRMVTGRRVSGWIGRLWVYFVMFVLAQPMIDSWHRRGLGGGMILPPSFSPMQTLVIPLIQWING